MPQEKKMLPGYIEMLKLFVIIHVTKKLVLPKKMQ